MSGKDAVTQAQLDQAIVVVTDWMEDYVSRVLAEVNKAFGQVNEAFAEVRSEIGERTLSAEARDTVGSAVALLNGLHLEKFLRDENGTLVGKMSLSRPPPQPVVVQASDATVTQSWAIPEEQQ